MRLSVWIRTFERDSENGSVVRYVIEVRHGSGAPWVVRRRYSELRQLYLRVKASGPKVDFPKRTIGRRLTDAQLERRRTKLQLFLSAYSATPTSQTLLDFLGTDNPFFRQEADHTPGRSPNRSECDSFVSTESFLEGNSDFRC